MNKPMEFSHFFLFATITALGTAGLRAGELNPPAGPMQPTNRTQLNEQWTTLPYSIDQPGSYVLTSNLTGVAGKHGVLVNASNVTIDLNGFTLLGVSGSDSGVATAPGITNLTVRNGVIQGWGDRGIGPQEVYQYCNDGLIESVHAWGNGTTGIDLGENCRVINCNASFNGDDGIQTNAGSVVINCTARRNTVNGFTTSGGATTFLNCASIDNGPSVYAEGFDLLQGCVLNNCTSSGNAARGIRAQEGAVITNCSIHNNGGVGIDAPNSLIRGNSVVGNAGGDCVGAGATVIDNHGCTNSPAK